MQGRRDNAESQLNTLSNRLKWIFDGLNEVNERTDNIKKFYNDEYYQSIKTMIDSNEELLPEEWLYYLLLTDDITTQFQNGVLDRIISHYKESEYFSNLCVLRSAYACSLETDPVKKQLLADTFCQDVRLRGELKDSWNNSCRSHNKHLFLNAPNMNFNGVKLSDIHLDYMIMRGIYF